MTDWLQVKNNAASELASAITAVATELTLKTGEGSRFPAAYPFHITIDDEILAVTDNTDDILTVTRAQESTSPATHNAGAAVRLNITSAIIEQFQTLIDSKQALLPLTTRGDLLAFGEALARLAVGADEQFLQADSSEELGVKWATITGAVQPTSGSYTGNSSANRAIPHGLGLTPKFFAYFTQAGSSTIGFGFIIRPGYFAGIRCESSQISMSYSNNTVTVWDATNVYVGNSNNLERTGNYTGFVYYWVAFA